MKAINLIEKFWANVKKGDDARIALQPVPTGYSEIKDVAYMGDGHKHHLYDVYRPEGNDDVLPTIIDIHGGGWYYGDKELNGYFCKSLVKHGFAVASVSYRLCPEVTFVEQIRDCVEAIKHIFAHADEYKMDKNNVFIAGDSAGGHIVGILCNLMKDKDLQAKYGVDIDFDIKAGAMICPACEPCEMLPLISKLYFNPLFGKGHEKNGMKEMTSFRSTLAKDIMPIFVVTAHADLLRKQSIDCFELLKQNGSDTQLFYGAKLPGAEHKLDHVFNVIHYEWQESQTCNAEMCAFFKKYIR